MKKQIIKPDENVLSLGSTRFLLLAATGKIDFNELAKEELAARGLGKDGKWVGFKEARRLWEV